MVIGATPDIYAPFQQAMIHEESSEEGSGLHSPVFAPPFPTHGDSFRYQHDQLDAHHSTTSMMPPQYGYANTLSPHQQQQPPMSDSALELPSASSARLDTHVSFNSHYAFASRNHLGNDFSGHPHANNSRTLPPAPQHPTQPIAFRYGLDPERRLPSGPSHDHSSYIRPTGTSSSMPMQNDHKSALVSSSARAETSPTADASTSSRETRKEIPPVVIACRQCRSRKIRCDSTRPVCNNCVRRSNECVYDLVPKRRGPDKIPGTRQRSCKKRSADGSTPAATGPPQKRKRTTADRSATSEQGQAPSAAPSTTASQPRQPTASSSRVKENAQKSSQQQALPLLEIQRQSPSLRPLDRHSLSSPHLQTHHHSHPHAAQHQHPHPYPHEPFPAHHHPQLHPSHHQHQATPSPTDLRMPSDTESHYKRDAGPAAPAYRGTRGSSSSYMYDQGSYPQSSYPRQLDVNTFPFSSGTRFPRHPKFPGPTNPIIQTDVKLWWEKILKFHSLNEIIDEIHFLVTNTSHFLSFINTTFLIQQLKRDEDRLRIQPSFILSILAMGKLMRSSAIEGKEEGRERALSLAREAKNAFDEAINSEWLDTTLSETALILALFESSAHPEHSPEKAATSLIQLDQLIHKLGLTRIDMEDPAVPKFQYNAVPTIILDNIPETCKCGGNAEVAPDRFSHNPYTLPWKANWHSDQIRDEEIRRVCWSALTLISEYVARCEAFNEKVPRFYITEPANFSLLFPGEVIDRESPAFSGHRHSLSPKESIWALYCRSMLLWNFCGRFRTPSQEEERAELATEATNEVMAIEDSLNAHSCNLDTTLIYTCREYIHNIRMLVTLGVRSFHGLDVSGSTPGPIFNRRQAEDWLFYEDQVIRRVNAVIHQLHTPAGYQLTRRPFRINWFINQLRICLVLSDHDPTLDDALKLGKSILIPIDVLNALWPCPSIQQQCDSLRQKLILACTSRNIDLPYPPDHSVPAFISS